MIPELPGIWMIKPRPEVLKTWSVSVGHSIVSADQTGVPVANLSARDVEIPKGIQLGTLESCTTEEITPPDAEVRLMPLQLAKTEEKDKEKDEQK